MVPGGDESVTVHATDADGSPCSFTVSNNDPEVASFTISDSTLQITGLEYGTADLIVTSETGLTCTIPVQVYDQFTIDTGELLVRYTNSYIMEWGAILKNFEFWWPRYQGWHMLGTLQWNKTWGTPSNYPIKMIVLKAIDGSDALAYPESWEVEWSSSYPSWTGPDEITIWNPIPPEGYVAMGSVAKAGDDTVPPSLTCVVCVREDLTIAGEAGEIIYAEDNFALYFNDSPDAGPHEFCYLPTGTSICALWGVNPTPATHPELNVLNVELPMLGEALQTYLPQLTNFEAPPLESPPVMAKAMLVPYTIVNDQLYSNNLSWQYANSPFYRLERQVFYKRLYHNHNTSSQPQTNSVTIISGVTTEESQSFWSETSVSVSVEAGISIGDVISGKVNTTVSESFGYQTQTSVTELEQKEVETSINTAPGTAAACWQMYNRFVLFRHNGVDLEPVDSWEFGIDSYVVDDYPDE
jgi:hypothetical protein